MRKSKLDWALSWAQRGFKVFPLLENAKEPVVSNFGSVATDDPATIRTWWHDSITGMDREYNIGVLTTDMVVADIDVKKGKPGLDTYRAHGGHFDTLTVGTPTGGYHCYFDGMDSSLSPVGKGLDIRSHNGYVVGPGSTIDGVEYTVVVDKPMAWVPCGIEATLRPPGRRPERDGDLVELDTPSAIANATVWARMDAPPAIEGMNGDNTTYQVCAKLVIDYGLSEEVAFHILNEEWNPRCSPAWDDAELWKKVENAYSFGTGSVGSARPETAFGQVVVPDPTPRPLRPALGFGNALDLADVPPRPWLMHRLLMRRSITLLPAAGSSGKSILVLAIAAHLAQGKSFGKFTTVAPCKSVIYNAEDDIQEQSRRLYAVCQAYGFDYPSVRDNVLLLTSDDIPLEIVTSANRSPVQNVPHVQSLVDVCSAPDVGLLALDPLVEIHNVDEQDNGHMRFVMAVLRNLARQADVALLVPHHTSKPGASAVGRAGSADVSRGASSITNSARIVMTLFSATDEDREVYGIPEEDRHRYVRLDDAKMNLTLASNDSVWFKKQGERLYNGDDVGVLLIHDMKKSEDSQRRFIAEALHDHLTSSNAASMSLKSAVGVLRASDPLYDRMTESACRGKIERALRTGVEYNGSTIVFKRETNGTGADKVLVVIQ